MLKKQTIDASFNTAIVKNKKIAIVKADYYFELNSNLEKACKKTLLQNGISTENIKTFTAPGSWELPLIAQAVAKSGEFDAIITFGIIVKGDTYHFDMIANECARALMQLSLDYSIPVAIEVLAVNNLKQAEERASRDDKNKGIEGAMAVLKALQSLDGIKTH